MDARKMNAEEVKVGCFQIVIVLLLGINYVIVAMSHAQPVFHNYTPKFYCQARNSTNRTYGCQDLSKLLSNDNETDSEELTDSCFGDYRFLTELDESSVVTEWGLVCEKRYLKYLSPIVYYIGVLIGACIAGVLSDRIGRLPVKAICLYTQGSMAVALYVVQNYPSFLALRALQGVFVQGLQNSTYILSLELFPAQARTFVALVMQVSWAIGLMLLAVLSYVIPDWRILQLAISVPTAVTVLYIWIIPESPRWLLAKGKSTEADIALERIAKYNGCCTRSSNAKKPGADEAEVKTNENVTPVKPERKSRISNVDVKKSSKDEDAREEVITLLPSAEVSQRKSRKSSMRVIPEIQSGSEKRLNVEQESSIENGETVRRDLPSSSRSHRKSKSTSQPIYNQRLSMKTAYEIVELKTHEKDEKTDENEKQNCKQIDGKANTEIKSSSKLFASPLVRRYSAVMTFQWLTSSMAWCVFSTLLPNFPINRHITFALGGVLEIATYIFLYVILSRYGRRFPLSIYQSLNGMICIVVAALTIFSGPAVATDISRTLVLLLGRVIVMSTISVEYLYTVEIFPTVSRGTCLGLCAVFAKIGSLCIPHVLLSGEYVAVSVPLILIGMLCLTSGGLALLLPETLNKVLPDATEDTELLTVETRRKKENESPSNEKPEVNEDVTQREILRAKLFSEDWVDAGNGILVNFSENRATE